MVELMISCTAPTMNLAGLFYYFQFLWAVPSFVFSRYAPRDFSKISQFEVRSLPGSPALPSSWAGRLPVPGAPKGNDIFFWLFEAEEAAYDGDLISE